MNRNATTGRKLTAALLGALCLASAAVLSPKAASALTVAPPVMEFSADPGRTVTDSIRIRNNEGHPLTVRADVENFTFKKGDEVSGEPELYPADENRDGRALAPWISLSKKSLTLEPGEMAGLIFDIKVPKDAEPGSRFGAIRLTSEPSAAGAGENVGVIGSAVVLVMLRINGQVVEDLKLTSFDGPRLMSHLPAGMRARFENDGTVHLRPRGTASIYGMSGRLEGAAEMNEGLRAVLPGSARRFDFAWAKNAVPESANEFVKEWKNFALGKYTANLVVGYGSEGKVLSASYDFWVIPWLVLLALAAGSVALVAGLYFALKTYGKWIVRRYQKKKEE